MGVFDSIRKVQIPNIPTEGYIWLSILIKYDYKTGKSELIRSFSRPAKDSSIKSIVKNKDKPKTKEFKIETTTETETLF